MTEQTDPGRQQPAGDEPQAGPPEMTAAERELLEQQLKQVRVEDLLTQTVATVLDLSARRIVKEDERDLEQARLGIEAIRALSDLLPPEVSAAVREPLSQIQMLYAQHSGDEGPAQPGGGERPEPDGSTGGDAGPSGRGGSGSGLWVPGDS